MTIHHPAIHDGGSAVDRARAELIKARHRWAIYRETLAMVDGKSPFRFFPRQWVVIRAR